MSPADGSASLKPAGEQPRAVPLPPPDRDLQERIARAREEAAKTPRRQRFMSFISSRRLLTVVAIAAIAAVAWGVPYYFWLKAPELPMKLAVVDKTVPFKDRREHKGLFWLLDQNKFVDPTQPGDERWYDLQRDYTGFDPEYQPELWRGTLLSPAILQDRDVLFFCDTYGVYRADYTQFAGDVASTIHSPAIFGGVTAGEASATEWFAQQGRTIIAEFNTCASPTAPDVCARMENVLGIHWTQWIGRYFADFRDVKDVPHWLYELYEKQHGKKWDIGGSGYMLCREESEEFVILRDGEDVKPPGLEFVPVQAFHEDVMQGVKPCTFTYWFDVIEPLPGTDVLAQYQFNATDSGRKKLAESGLKGTFPAVCRRTNGHIAYYSAGELVDFNRAMGPPDTRLTLYVNRSFYSQLHASNDAVFFWHTAYPLLTNILRRECNRLTGQPVKVYLWK